jgi:hypothetical protein
MTGFSIIAISIIAYSTDTSSHAVLHKACMPRTLLFMSQKESWTGMAQTSRAAMMPAETDTGVRANHFCLLNMLLTHLSLTPHAKAKEPCSHEEHRPAEAQRTHSQIS